MTLRPKYFALIVSRAQLLLKNPKYKKIMKHSQVKGKTIKFTLTTEYGEAYKAGIRDRLNNRLQPIYYDIKNDVEIEDTGKSFTGKASRLTKFFFNKDELEQFIKAFNVTSTLSLLTKDEKVNRFKVEFTNFTMDAPYSLPERGPLDGDCEIHFRPGGGYTVKREGKDCLSYGPKLKASQFNEKGFSITDCAGAVLHYVAKATS